MFKLMSELARSRKQLKGKTASLNNKRKVIHCYMALRTFFYILL